MKQFKRCLNILKRTGAIHILSSFIIFACITAFLLLVFEPAIDSFGDGIWYCFVSSTTIGFGDICATTFIGRILTAVCAVYGIVVTAVVTGVVVTYYTEYLQYREKQTISIFLDKLEQLPDLSKQELHELSDKVKKFKTKL